MVDYVVPGMIDSSAGALSNRNKIINGAMVIDQRNAGASVTGSSSSNVFPVDRWFNTSTQNSKLTLQQNAGSVTPPAGFKNYVGVTSSSAYSVLTGDLFTISHRIEGYNAADLMWGTASAQTVTLSFWVRSSLTGIFGGAFGNNAINRSYPFSYTINSANTWEQKTVTVVGDTTGTWEITNLTGISIYFGLGSGSTYSGTAGSWVGGAYLTTTGATSVVGTNGATFYITGVQLERGSVATAFEYRNYQQELAMCYRYYRQRGLGLRGCQINAATHATFSWENEIVMRSSPTLSLLTTSIGRRDPDGSLLTSSSSTIVGGGIYLNNAKGGSVRITGWSSGNDTRSCHSETEFLKEDAEL